MALSREFDGDTASVHLQSAKSWPMGNEHKRS